jgi:hypothetical protein
MSYNMTVVHYDGTNVGPIYLKDIGQRSQLGGGKGIYTLGQDRYIDPGTDTTFVSTSDVMLSVTKGVLSKLVANGNVTVETVVDA